MKLYPKGVKDAQDVAMFIKATVGTTVYNRHDIGDFNGIESVVIPAGTKGLISEFIISSGGWWKVAVLILPSPGQTLITTILRDFNTLWTTEEPAPPPVPPPEPPRPKNRYDVLMEDRWG